MIRGKGTRIASQIGKLTLLVCLLMGSFSSVEAKGKPWSRKELREWFTDERVVELVIAANKGDVAKIDLLVQEGADVNYKGKNDITPLYAAFHSMNLPGFKRLLEHGADPNVPPTTHGYSVMWLLVRGDKPAELIEMLKLALQHGGNPNWRYHNPPVRFTRESEGAPLIETALVSEQALEKIQILLDAGADINGKDKKGFTALSKCAPPYDIAYFLLQAGADYTIKDNFGKDFIWNIENFPPSIIGDQNEVEKQRIARGKIIEFLKGKGVILHLKYPE